LGLRLRLVRRPVVVVLTHVMMLRMLLRITRSRVVLGRIMGEGLVVRRRRRTVSKGIGTGRRGVCIGSRCRSGFGRKRGRRGPGICWALTEIRNGIEIWRAGGHDSLVVVVRKGIWVDGNGGVWVDDAFVVVCSGGRSSDRGELMLLLLLLLLLLVRCSLLCKGTATSARSHPRRKDAGDGGGGGRNEARRERRGRKSGLVRRGFEDERHGPESRVRGISHAGEQCAATSIIAQARREGLRKRQPFVDRESG
jgi:hypothetical protein